MDTQVVFSIESYVRAGFYSPSQILAIICDEAYASDQLNPQVVMQIIEEKMEIKLLDEKKWARFTHNDLLDRFYRNLNKSGIIALQNVKDYSNGLDEVTDIYQDQKYKNLTFRGFCFYQWQDTEFAISGGGLRLSFGDVNGDKEMSLKIGHFICNGLQKSLPKAEWDGNLEKKIYIRNFKWRRRIQKEEENRVVVNTKN